MINIIFIVIVYDNDIIIIHLNTYGFFYNNDYININIIIHIIYNTIHQYYPNV